MRTGALEALISIESALISHAKTMQGGTNAALAVTKMKVKQKMMSAVVGFRRLKPTTSMAEIKIEN
jgi:hypothetical protein